MLVTFSAGAFAQQASPAPTPAATPAPGAAYDSKTPGTDTPEYGKTFDVNATAPVIIAPTANGPRCPWMNLGTAGGLIGGNVTVTLAKDALGTINKCTFDRTAGAGQLEIELQPSATAATFASAAHAVCPARSTPLRAIGNEAVECRQANASVVTGRVRDQIFTVRIAVPDATAAEAKVRDAAEQISGNLF